MNTNRTSTQDLNITTPISYKQGAFRANPCHLYRTAAEGEYMLVITCDDMNALLRRAITSQRGHGRCMDLNDDLVEYTAATPGAITFYDQGDATEALALVDAYRRDITPMARENPELRAHGKLTIDLGFMLWDAIRDMDALATNRARQY